MTIIKEGLLPPEDPIFSEGISLFSVLKPKDRPKGKPEKDVADRAAQLTEQQVLDIDHLDEGSVVEIQAALGRYGLALSSGESAK